MEQAIKKAIEGGFERPRLMDGRWEDIHQTLLRSAFWVALGKSMGWSGLYKDYEGKTRAKNWLNIWHDFIDHIAEGKGVDSFFTDLLSDKLK